MRCSFAVLRWLGGVILSMGLGAAMAGGIDPQFMGKVDEAPVTSQSDLLIAESKRVQGDDMDQAMVYAELALSRASAQNQIAEATRARLQKANLLLLRSRTADAEPLLAELARAIQDPKLVRFGAELKVLQGRALILQRDNTRAEQMLIEALSLARELGDRMSEAKALHNRAQLLIRVGRQDEAKQLLEASLALNKADGRDREADANRHYLGNIARDQGRFADALRLHLEVIDHGRARADVQVIAQSALALGILYGHQEQSPESIAYFREAADAFARLGDHYSEAMALINIGNALHDDDHSEVALPYLDRALKVALDDRQPDAEALARTERARALAKLKRFEEAEAEARKGLALATTGGTRTRLAQANTALGHVLNASSQHSAALPVLQQAVALASETGRIPEERDALDYLVKTELALGLSRPAAEHLDRLRTLENQIRSDRVARQMAELSVRHESERKQAELAAQAERIRLLEQQSVQQQRIRYLLATALLMSGLLIVALISRYRNKQRAEAALRKQHEAIAKANADLAEAADTDVLTGARNRRYFQRELQPKLDAAEAAGQRYALALIDADYFKQINDRYGHDIGDAALIAIVNAWAPLVGDSGSLVRFGGEEFLAVWLGVTPELVQARLEAGLAATRRIALSAGGEVVGVRVSVGWAIGPEPSLTSIDLLRLADARLLQAKSDGRDRAVGPSVLSRK